MYRSANPRDGQTIRLLRRQQGSVMVEVLLGLPILFLVLAFVLHLASAYYINTHMQQASALAARHLAMGQLDNETNGIHTLCSQLTGTAPASLVSAEAAACTALSHLNADFSIQAMDDNGNGLPSAGSDVSVSIHIPRDQVTLMLWSFTNDGPQLYQARTSMQAQANIDWGE